MPISIDEFEAHELFIQLIEDAPGPDLDRLPVDSGGFDTTVDPVPLARGLTLEQIITEKLDFLHHEAFYVVDADFEVTAYRTLWFGLQYVAETVEHGPTIGNGVLRTVRWYNDEPVGDGYVLGEFAGLKRVVGDCIDRGVFLEEEAIEYMKAKLCEWAGDREEMLIRTP